MNSIDGSLRIPPRNFFWVVDGKLAGMGWPKSKENIAFLIHNGIKHLITLSPEKRPSIKYFPELRWTEIAIEEFEAPTLEQIKDFIRICESCQEQNEAVGIHCRQGRGRTGVMAACYLVRFQNSSPGKAISDIRIKQGGSVETYEQEKAVSRYYDYIRSID